MESDWAASYEPKPGRLRGYVWWCEDEWCDCTQAKIERVERVELPDGRPGFYRYTLLWEGDFHTDGEHGATTELNREARRLRQHHHHLHRQIEWPWDRTKAEQRASSSA